MRTPIFHTERLILKKLSESHIPSYKRHFVDYDIIKNLSRTVSWPYPENGVEDYLNNVVFPSQETERWSWGIFLKLNPEELIGCVDIWLNGSPENRGFWLGKKFWNKGIMTEAVVPIIDFAFNKLKFKSLIFSNAVGNLQSRRIKEKTGCELIEILPAKFVDPSISHQEIWKLELEKWEDHKLSNPSHYREVE